MRDEQTDGQADRQTDRKTSRERIYLYLITFII